jgi:hypothetical protein
LISFKECPRLKAIPFAGHFRGINTPAPSKNNRSRTKNHRLRENRGKNPHFQGFAWYVKL